MTASRKYLAILVPAALLALAAAAPAGAARPSGIVAAWTQVVPESISKSRLQARAVVPNGVTCPKVKKTRSDGSKSQGTMTMRSPGATTGPAFASLRACVANLPSGLTSASVGSISVPASLPSKIDRIAAFGDVGCRVTTSQIQNCTDPNEWPMAKITQRVANEKPDVIFFTGDFLYREANCPVAELAKCGGSPGPAFEPVAGKFPPFSDTDYSWMADALIPMAPAFSAAPILAARGNHESCFRGGNGWMMFFEVKLKSDACAPNVAGPDGQTPKTIAPSYAVDFPVASGRKLRVVMVDSNEGSNSSVNSWTPTQRGAYESANKLAAPKSGRESWLITHRPMFGVDAKSESDPGDLNWTSITQTAAGQGLIANYNMMLASHVHVAQVVQIPGQPAQVVLGNGGSVPDSTDPAQYALPAFGPMNDDKGQPLVDRNTNQPVTPYPNAEYLQTWIKYGYALFTPGSKSGKWTISHRGVDGKQFSSCNAKGKTVTCK